MKRLTRWGRALRYALNCTTPADAQAMLHEMEAIAGWYPLSSVCAEDVLTHALETWEDSADLRRLVDDATRHVSTRWDDSGAACGEAQDRAIDKIAEFAHAEGIRLEPAAPTF